jgi:hypothetical protein
MTEEWVLAATAFVTAFGVGLLGMLSAIMRPMLGAMSGRDFRAFMEAFLRYAGNGWGKAYNFAWAIAMTIGPAVVLVLLRDDAGSTSFVLTAIALAVNVVGILVVSNAWKTPTYNKILAWDPDDLPAGWEATRHTYFTINAIQLVVTWTVLALLLVALVEL